MANNYDDDKYKKYMEAVTLAFTKCWVSLSNFHLTSYCCICHRTVDKPSRVNVYCLDCVWLCCIDHYDCEFKDMRQKLWHIEDRLEDMESTSYPLENVLCTRTLVFGKTSRTSSNRGNRSDEALPIVDKTKRKSKEEERNPYISGKEKERQTKKKRKHEQAEVDMESNGDEKGQRKKKRRVDLDTEPTIKEQSDVPPEHEKKKKKRKHEEAELDWETNGVKKRKKEKKQLTE